MIFSISQSACCDRIPHGTTAIFHAEFYLAGGPIQLWNLLRNPNRQWLSQCSSIFSINIPNPLVASWINTWVTASISFPFWRIGLPLIPCTIPPVFSKSTGISYLDYHAFICISAVQVNFLDFRLVFLHFSFYGAENRGCSFLNLLFIGDFYRSDAAAISSICLFAVPKIPSSVFSPISPSSSLCPIVNDAWQLARHAPLSFCHWKDVCMVQGSAWQIQQLPQCLRRWFHAPAPKFFFLVYISQRTNASVYRRGPRCPACIHHSLCTGASFSVVVSPSPLYCLKHKLFALASIDQLSKLFFIPYRAVIDREVM